MHVTFWAWMLVVLACGQAVRAEPAQIVRVGTSGDYAPFSTRSAGSGAEADGEVVRYGGFDPAVARAWGEARGIELRFVEFAWPHLLDDIAADRFDVAMSGITIRPERSVAGRFSVPVATSGAVVLLPADSPLLEVSELDRTGLRIAVNAGGHLERVARDHFPSAELLRLDDNAAVPRSLAEGRADAVVTDTLEAPLWIAQQPGLRALGPFTRDRKAYLFGPDDRELARDLDTWLQESEANGSLARLRARHLGEAGAQDAVAAAFPALLAALDERLALMPWVAEAKRRSGKPVEAPDREALVLASAYRGVQEAAAERQRARGENARRAPSARAVRRFFVAQIEAAKDIQRATLAEPTRIADPPAPDLSLALRPALIRIGQRIAFLLIDLPPDLSRSGVRESTREALAHHGLSSDRMDEIADALHAVSSGPAASSTGRSSEENANPP